MTATVQPTQAQVQGGFQGMWVSLWLASPFYCLQPLILQTVFKRLPYLKIQTTLFHSICVFAWCVWHVDTQSIANPILCNLFQSFTSCEASFVLHIGWYGDSLAGICVNGYSAQQIIVSNLRRCSLSFSHWSGFIIHNSSFACLLACKDPLMQLQHVSSWPNKNLHLTCDIWGTVTSASSLNACFVKQFLSHDWYVCYWCCMTVRHYCLGCRHSCMPMIRQGTIQHLHAC